MMRVYQSVKAGVVKSLVLVQDFLIKKKHRLRGLVSGREAVDRRVARAVGLVLVVVLVGMVSLSARHRIAGLVRKSQVSVASWRSSESNPTKLIHSLTERYSRYGKWRSAQTGKAARTEASSPNAANAGPMPVMPMSPPPEAPPTFTNNPLEVGVTIVQALHITELRDAINLVRARVGLPAASWEAGAASGQPIKATHIQEMRTKLDQARAAVGLGPVSYSLPAPGVGAQIRAAHVQEIRDGVLALFNTTANASAAVARLDPANQTGGGGENPLSRNYNWSVPLFSLPGRSGLDLGLSLSYNSLVWTKRGSSSISFNDDGGFPSPGFRLGFPVIQLAHYNSEANKVAFLLITPDGGHVELRQVNASTLYEAADSSHLIFNAATLKLRTTDGTQLSYALKGGEYQCTEIKDQNGNYITVNYTNFDRIDTVVDTLSRTIKFNYDGTNYLTSITQAWAGQTEPHVWATFFYNPTQSIQTNFTGLTVLGPQNGSTIKVLTQVTLEDNSAYTFDTTVWGQIWKITSRAADGHVLNYRAYNLPGDTPAHTECPRFTERHDWAENANRSGPDGPSRLPAGAEQEVLTASWIVPESATWNYLPDGTQKTGMMAKVTAVDGSHTKIYYEGVVGPTTGWQRGLPSMVETWGSTIPGGSIIKQKSSVTKWIQDSTNVSYILNPRVEETNVYDFKANGQVQNRARTQIIYPVTPLSIGDGTSCSRPAEVLEYQADASTVLRRTVITYTPLTSEYISRRIIGLVSEKKLYEGPTGAETLKSRVAFDYDQAGSVVGPEAPVQHDNTDYTASFVTGRGNLTSVTRHNVEASGSTVSKLKYNPAGSVVASINPLEKETSISYVDSFSDDLSRNTFAYPTTVTDPDNFSSTVKYNHNFGLVTRTQGPPPAGQTVGAIKHFIYDDPIVRIKKVATEFNGNADYSHVRFEYPASQTRVDTYTTIQEGVAEGHSFKIFDGYGRTIASASNHPNSTGGFSGRLVLYDNLGLAIKTSNPTETNASGVPAQWEAKGDDDLNTVGLGWLYTEQTYDWKGRPLVTTNPDDTTKTASYEGCGCAGGEEVTLTDEGTIEAGVPKRRQRKVYSDVLGRTVKTEMLNWEGGSVYSTVVNTFNARDQVTLVRQYQGAEGGVHQETTMGYDGLGRLHTKHAPEQQQDSNNPASTDHTTWEYNDDDSVRKMTDARGAVTDYTYNNNRGLVTGINYSVLPGVPTTGPSAVVPAPGVTYGYDAAGNRTSMTDGLGHVDYVYNQLSRLESENRFINGISNPLPSPDGGYEISYTYNLANQLESVEDPFNSTFEYGRDSAGRLLNVTGSIYAGVTSYVSDVEYRAWGAPKSVSYGNATSSTTAYNGRLQATEFRLTFNGTGGSFIRENYTYFADGRLSGLTDLDDTLGTNPPWTQRFLSRSYSYDQAGRVTTARGTQGTPFDQFYGYDEFNNLRFRGGHYYYQGGTQDIATFTNNKRDGWSYNADGQLAANPATSTDDAHNLYYNAAGRLVTNVDFGANGPNTTATYNSSYDGDGHLVFESQVTTGSPSSSSAAYILRSTALGGEVLTRLTQSGNKSVTHVPAEGLLFARQAIQFPFAWPNGAYVGWSQRNPLGITETGKGVYDPLGNYIPFQQMNDPRPPPGSYNSASMGGIAGSFANPEASGLGCLLDGMPANCSRAMQSVNNGSAYYNGVISRIGNGIVTEIGLTYDQQYVRVGKEWQSATSMRFFRNLVPGGQPGFEPNPQNTSPYVDRDVLARCIRDQFGVELREFLESRVGLNGTFTGFGPDRYTASSNIPGATQHYGNNTTITVVNEVKAYGPAKLRDFYNTIPPAPSKKVGLLDGYMGPTPDGAGGSQYTPYRNFTANDITNLMRLIEVQVHELGNSLQDITGAMNNERRRVRGDPDAGAKLEKCVRDGGGFKR
ncbi:MAG: hypothetical protein ND895_05400 [Pyrinomonadaceae bacterium]|nr:hypothetical protein [Pyrinomonadaceae bacterium]